MDPVSIGLMTYCACLCVFFIINPRWGLLLFFSTKFTIDIFWDHILIGGFSILKITGIAFPALCLVYFLWKKPAVSANPLWKLLIAIFFLNILASLWGYLNGVFLFLPLPHTPVSAQRLFEWNFRFLNMAGVFLLIPFVLNEIHDKILLLRAFLISTFIPASLSCVEISRISMDKMTSRLSDPYSAGLFDRVTGMYHDPGTLSIVIFSAIIISALLFFIDPVRKLRTFYAAYCFLTSVILYFTYSRTFWISITIFFICFFWVRKKYLLTMSAVAVAFLVITAVPLTQKRFERELFLFNNPEQFTRQEELQKLGAGRLWLWNDARQHFMNLDVVSKIIGSGGAYGSHNQYISWLLRNGLIGMAVWAFFLYNTAFLLWKRYKFRSPERDVLGVFVLTLFSTVVLITNMATQPLDNTTFSYFFWSIIGLYLAGNDPTKFTPAD